MFGHIWKWMGLRNWSTSACWRAHLAKLQTTSADTRTLDDQALAGLCDHPCHLALACSHLTPGCTCAAEVGDDIDDAHDDDHDDDKDACVIIHASKAL